MLIIHSEAEYQIGKEYKLTPSEVCVLSALHHCIDLNKSSSASTTEARKVLPSLNLKSFYAGLITLRKRRFIEIVGNHEPKGRTPRKYTITGLGLMIIRSYNVFCELKLNPHLNMVAEPPPIYGEI